MSSTLRIDYSGYSDIGLVRKENQDTFGAFPQASNAPNGEGRRLFIVADGMGGHKGGGDASRIAVEVLCDSFSKSSGDPVPVALRKAFQQANEAIYEESLQLFPPGIMGSTCTVLAIAGESGYIGHVGDSRAYKITSSAIQQLTEDHSVVGELQRRGLLDKEGASSHPERSQITRALGVKPEVKVDIIENIALGGSDRFLLCTDGLSNALSDEELRDTVLALDAKGASRALVDLAVSRGGEDNITAQVIHVQRASTQD
jgi:PPM family protein phosphatase